MGQINECKIGVFQAGGATSYAFNDAGYEFLVAKGVTPGHINDMWMTYLASEGYSGALSDMMWAYWVDQACLGNEAATEWFLTLTGTQYGELAEPVTFTSDFEIEADCTIGADSQMRLIGEVSSAGNYVRFQDSATDTVALLSAGGNVTWPGTIPDRDSRHTYKIARSGTSAELWVDEAYQGAYTIGTDTITFSSIGVSNAFNYFQGIIHSVKLSGTGVDTQTWTLNSGPPVYETGAEMVSVPHTWDTDISTGVTERTYTFDYTGSYAVLLQDIDMFSADLNQPVLVEITADVISGNYAVTVGNGNNKATSESLTWITTPLNGTDGRLQIATAQFTGTLTISIKPYISTLSDGTLYEEADEFPREADIMREDDWATPPAGVTVSGRTATFSGTQAGSSQAFINAGELHTGPHIITFRGYGETAGAFKVDMINSPFLAIDKVSGVYTIIQNPTAQKCRVICDLAGDFNGSVEIISIHPAPHLMLYKNVLAGDWREVVAVVAITYLADFSDITNSFLVGVV